MKVADKSFVLLANCDCSKITDLFCVACDFCVCLHHSLQCIECENIICFNCLENELCCNHGFGESERRLNLAYKNKIFDCHSGLSSEFFSGIRCDEREKACERTVALFFEDTLVSRLPYHLHFAHFVPCFSDALNFVQKLKMLSKSTFFELLVVSEERELFYDALEPLPESVIMRAITSARGGPVVDLLVRKGDTRIIGSCQYLPSNVEALDWFLEQHDRLSSRYDFVDDDMMNNLFSHLLATNSVACLKYLFSKHRKQIRPELVLGNEDGMFFPSLFCCFCLRISFSLSNVQTSC